MSLTDSFKNMSNLKKIIIAAAAIVIVAAAVLCIVFARRGYVATTMRLIRVEGAVNIEDAKGATKPVMANVRFQSGDALNTGADGLASVGLDNTKIVTLQNDSRAEFKKKNKQLELKLTKGAVFFNVTEKLKADEKFEIKTSTMTAGIRGTSGMVYYDAADGREALLITDGAVEVSATNPETGETKTALVESGQEIKVYLYFDRVQDSVAFELSKVTEANLPKFAASRIAENEALAKRVCDANNWQKDSFQRKSAQAEETTVPTTEAPTTTTEEVTTTTTTAAPSETTESTTVTESTTAKPTATPTPKPKATATPKPTKKTTPEVTQTTPESTPESTPETTPETAPETTPETTPESEPSTTTKATTTTTTTKPTSSEPEIPDGYEKNSEGWGATYSGSKVYIAKKSRHWEEGADYLGYVNGSWVALQYTEQKVQRNMQHRYTIVSNSELYYLNSYQLY
ncbi:MAG: FecR domain-containing protein [Clostridiales bacterium]|nr:FecR domain-containing protein [Clostridiales bacterium]